MTEYCCNEPMQATYRYKKGDILWQSFICHGCGSKREAPVPRTSYEVSVRCQS